MAKDTLSAAEKAALKETVAERKRQQAGADGEADVQDAIAKMPPADRAIAARIHELVHEHAPSLTPKTWYGMPAYANAKGKVVVFFQNASKFKYRYATLGFQEDAHLDDGEFWPVSYAVLGLTPTVEEQIVALLTRAIG